MERGIYRIRFSSLLILFFIVSCGKVGPIVPRAQLIPRMPEIKRVFVGSNYLNIVSEFPIVEKGGFKVGSTAVEVITDIKKQLFYLKNLKKTGQEYVIHLNFRPKWLKIRLISVYGKGKSTDKINLINNKNLKKVRILNYSLMGNGFYIKIRKNKKYEGYIKYFSKSGKKPKMSAVLIEKSDKVVFTPLVLNNTYDFYLIGVLKCGDKIFCLSKPAVLTNIKIKDIIPPNPPDSLLAVRRGSKVILKWSPVIADDFSYYLIFRKKNFTDSWKILAKTTKNSYNDSKCDVSEKCFYSIKAVDKYGNESVMSQYSDVGGN